MATTIKQLLDKNKKSFDNKCFIESINLSYILINKALKQIVKDELNQEVIEQKIKTSNLIHHIKKEFIANPACWRFELNRFFSFITLAKPLLLISAAVSKSFKIKLIPRACVFL